MKIVFILLFSVVTISKKKWYWRLENESTWK